MSNYHVTKNKDLSMWQAKHVGAERVSGYYDTQSAAEKAAKDFVAKNGGGEIRIHRPTGPIRDSDTVASGKDPNPPKDKKF